MNRRDAIGAMLALATMTVPWHANAQATAGPFRIVTLPDLPPSTRGWLSEAMRELGWAEGRGFVILQSGLQWGDWQLAEAVKRVVLDKPDLVVTVNTAYAVALHRATATIPIVMLYSGYPVEIGLANSLARPGKNVTGNTSYAGLEVWSKLLQLLREAKPDIKRVGVLWTYVPPAFPKEEIEPAYTELRNAERLLGIKVHIAELASADQVQAALTAIDDERPDALLLTSGFATNVGLGSTVMQFAVERHLPTITDASWSSKIEPNPLLVYGPVLRELVRSAAASIDKILKGAKPGDLPIQQPAKFEMVVNLKTAKTLGLPVPPSLLARADEVIE